LVYVVITIPVIIMIIVTNSIVIVCLYGCHGHHISVVAVVLLTPQKFVILNVAGTYGRKVKRYKLGLASNGKTFILYFVKYCPAFELMPAGERTDG
jgi:hypothetical protein